jgi:hypothetical protein
MAHRTPRLAIVGIALALISSAALGARSTNPTQTSESQQLNSEQPTPAIQPPPSPPENEITAPSRQAEPECILHLTTGRQLTGLLVSRSDNEVVIRVGGIATPFKREQIDRLEILPPVLDRYRAMRATIDDTDTQNLLLLVEWLRTRELYTQALAELDLILIREPFNPKAREQHTLITQLQRLRERAPSTNQSRTTQSSTPGNSPDGSPETASTEPTAARPARRTFPLLSEDDINLIKVYEIDLAKPPRMRIDRSTIEALIQAYSDSELIPTSKEGRDALYRQSPERILDLMFRLRARDFYSRVKVLDQPEAMKQFRADVHSAWLINACATDRCHGGTDAGRLALYNRARNADPAVYTNFLILERFKLTDGTPLIDYDQPHRSPLLHLALPRERSLYPHPDTPAARGWRPTFTSQRDRRYEDTLNWIRAMYRPRPDYPVTYEPPQPRSLLDLPHSDPDGPARDDPSDDPSNDQDQAPNDPPNNPPNQPSDQPTLLPPPRSDERDQSSDDQADEGDPRSAPPPSRSADPPPRDPPT